ncbi:MAG: hypothetical protein ACI94Y_003045 [Maribacter sp.]|jgi:hypothetical protein
MKYLIAIALFISIFSSCGTAGLPDTYFENIDRVSVEMSNSEGESYEVLNTTDENEIKKYISAISNQSAPIHKCGYHGSLIFHREMTMIDGSFNLSEDCQHIIFLDEKGALKSLKLTEEGRKLLLGFREKGKAKEEIEPVIFHFYGESVAVGYEIPDSLALPYGFIMKRIGGSISQEEAKAVKANNEKGVQTMIERHGDDWRTKFEQKTGRKLGPYPTF